MGTRRDPLCGGRLTRLLVLGAALALASPALARDSLGMFGAWGAFRDAAVPRCYAIAMSSAPGSQKVRDYQPYATVGYWPQKRTRNQVHFRLSRRLAPQSAVRLTVGRQSFTLAGGGGDAWAADKRGDAGIVAAMRSAASMRISARAANGTTFSDSYPLAGSASAIDAAAIGCAKSARG